MKKSVKDFSKNTVSKDVASRKKRKEDVLKDGVAHRMVLPDQSVGGSWRSKAGDTTKLDSVNMKREFLIEETSVDYREKDIFEGIDSNQTLKSPRLVTKQALGKINFLDNNDNNDILLDEPMVLPSPLKKLDKLAIVRKLFSKINGFGEASTPSKFFGIIWATFTSKSSLIKATKLAADVKILVNTDLKKLTGHSDRAVVLKKIPVGTSAKAVRAVLSEFGMIKSIKMQLNQADLLVARWSILIGKDAVCVARSDLDKLTWDIRDHYRVLLYTLPVGTNAYNVWDFIGSVGEKTCVIDCHLIIYTWAKCAIVCFKLAESLDAIMGITPVLKSVHLCWSYLGSAMCTKCEKLGHTSLDCVLSEKSFSNADKSRLAAIYAKHSAPVAHPVSFGGVSWAKIVGGSSFFSPLVRNGLVNAGSSLEMKSTLPVMSDLEIRFAVLESSIASLMGQIGKLAKRLDLFMLTDQVGNVVMRKGLSGATSSNTAAILVSSTFPKVKRLENMLKGLSTLVLSLTAKFDGLILASDFVWKIAMCNVCRMNNLAKQDNVICWHKDMDNLISIFTESKLKKKVCPWIANSFDGVRVFTSDLNSGYLGAGVAVVMNNSLAKHVCKVSKVPGWLISIRLLFRNKFLVSILGLYAGASSAMNDSSFVILGSNFNKNRSHRCASYKKCFDLGLVNSLNRSSVAKTPTWSNSRGVLKTIDYLFISSNLVNMIVDHGVADIVNHFNTDHKAVSVSMGLGGLLDVCLILLCKQANKNCWKFNVKNANDTK
ncbi:hypothetical protein G9A89_014579 [Geosiphon pyriformis]|nr:hypothetical protein G9A89_014579 [Geosiphon pyriformis]